MSTPVSVFVASSDRLFADAAAAFFDRTKGWTCAGVAYDGIGALAALGRVAPAALLITEDVGRLGSSALAVRVHARWPWLTIVVLGEHDNREAHVVGRGEPTQRVLSALGAAPVATAGGSMAKRTRELALLAGLTKRERVVLKLLANGTSPAATARELGVSANTVRTHMQNLYDKLDCHSRLDLVRFAERHGLIAVPADDA